MPPTRIWKFPLKHSVRVQTQNSALFAFAYNSAATRNTIELLIGNEVVLKARLETPLAYAAFVADFEKAKEVFEKSEAQRDGEATERAQKRADSAKAETERYYKNPEAQTLGRRQWAQAKKEHDEERKNRRGSLGDVPRE
jgi:hypothetical protein